VQVRPEVDPPDEAELIAHCRAHVAGYKAPKLVVFVPEIRRSPSGKADYPWAARIAREAVQTQGETATTTTGG